MKTHRMFFDDAGNVVPEAAATQMQELTVDDSGRVTGDAWFKAAEKPAAEATQPELPLTPLP